VGELINIFGNAEYTIYIKNGEYVIPMLRFVTTNRHKFLEIEEIAARFGIDLEMIDRSYIEIQSPNLIEIAKEGARTCANDLGKGFFLEDSGLFVEKLKGFPGPYSSYVHSTIGNGGILDLLGDSEERSAYFLSIICFFDGEYNTFEGRVDGTITHEARGQSGFGFDPIFKPTGSDATFAEMGDRKNEFSHRSRCAEIFFRSLTDRD
jgi:XTP/dITP diphosphohydrolase